MRPSVASATTPSERKQLADDVQYYLSLAPRQLPSQYLYDELGSALFEAICRLPWYPITRTERGLLDAHGAEILSRAGHPAAIVELGPGSGAKLAALLETRRDRRALNVHLVDVSAAALEASRRAIEVYPEIAVSTHQDTYEAGLATAARATAAGARTLALFLGSNIGNFDPPGAEEFLLTIRAALARGDALLLGADLVKPEPDLLVAYADPLGVTAAFNRNLLVRINRELGADFDLAGFSHRAIWNEAASRVEMHLASRRRQQVRIPAASLEITFEADETIWTESSYKYQPAQIAQMLERAGFRCDRQWRDEQDTFALTLATAA